MIGPMSSSLALAQRTASKARATMDDMSRQIATGQKVSSVKDDGAAWAVSQGLKRDAALWDYRSSEARRVQPLMELEAFHNEEGLKLQQDAIRILRQAASSAPNSNDRRRFANEWLDIQSRWSALKVAYDGLTNNFDAVRTQGVPAVEWHINPWQGGDAVLSAVKIPDSWWLSNTTGGSSIGVNLVAYSPNLYQVDQDFVGSSIAQFNQAIVELAGGAAGITRTEAQVARLSATAKHLTSIETHSDKMSDRLVAAAGSLTDADLGKASTARANAETRQQLALSTISQAISAYGNFANALLGNVQRTQRGVLA
jgi:flagellin